MKSATIICLVLLVAFVTADVSHLTNAYLPPLHSSAGDLGTAVGGDGFSGRYASLASGHQGHGVHGQQSYHALGPATHTYRISRPAPVLANSYADQSAHVLTGHGSSSTYSAPSSSYLPPVSNGVHRYADPAISSYSSGSSTVQHGSHSAPSVYTNSFAHGSTGIDTQYAANGGYVY